MAEQPRFTFLGWAASIVLIGGLVALGAFMILRGRGDSKAPAGSAAATGETPEVSEVKVVRAIGYVVEQLLTGSEDERVARRRAQRRRTARRELEAHRRRTTDAARATGAGPLPLSARVRGGDLAARETPGLSPDASVA